MWAVSPETMVIADALGWEERSRSADEALYPKNDQQSPINETFIITSASAA